MEKLPNGIQSIVKERGGGFSEGQAQRLSIADTDHLIYGDSPAVLRSPRLLP